MHAMELSRWISAIIVWFPAEQQETEKMWTNEEETTPSFFQLLISLILMQATEYHLS